jgi:hypothetical protein
MRNIGVLFLALTAGCATVTKPLADAPPAVAGPATAPATAPTPAPAPASASASAAKKPAPRAPATPVPAARAPAPANASPASRASPAATQAGEAPHLDLKGLERRLKDTKAIGIFTKLALKNQVDDLVSKFRAYHDGQQPPTLADLRPNYELLIMKVQSLIQKDDPVLADDVTRSREAIWGVLADKSKFTLI